MKVLFLGNADSPLIPFIELTDKVVQTAEKITPEFARDFDFLISYGYRHILKKELLDVFRNSDGYIDKAINLHISFLPWNRGADPNLWSHVKETPKGVTIHYMDEGLDTGDIIAQEEVEFDRQTDTLGTSYNKLQIAIQKLFKDNWQLIKTGQCPRNKQQGIGSYHHSRDKERVKILYSEQGFNTPISRLFIY